MSDLAGLAQHAKAVHSTATSQQLAMLRALRVAQASKLKALAQFLLLLVSVHLACSGMARVKLAPEDSTNLLGV